MMGVGLNTVLRHLKN
ncbi:TPA: IS1-like element transposase, partial [Klebsiella pneumoniae]